MKRVSIGSDHVGFDLKQELLTLEGPSFLDEGCFSLDRVDYPDYAQRVCTRILSREADLGVLICGTGIGMSIAANRFPGIRAALCMSPEHVLMSRRHNDANILVLGARISTPEDVKTYMRLFLETPFEGGRHVPRIAKLDHLTS